MGKEKCVSNVESSYHSLCCQGFTEYQSVDIKQKKKGKKKRKVNAIIFELS